MQFGDKIRAARQAGGMTQKALAEAIGVTTRTIQLYEANDRQPRNATSIISLAHALNVGTDYFLSEKELDRIREQEAFLSEATDKYGTRGRAQAHLILDQASALFAGGELSADDQEAFFQTMTEIYFDAKAKAKKYAPSRGK